MVIITGTRETGQQIGMETNIISREREKDAIPFIPQIKIDTDTNIS